jgi:hypothetical protein
LELKSSLLNNSKKNSIIINHQNHINKQIDIKSIQNLKNKPKKLINSLALLSNQKLKLKLISNNLNNNIINKIENNNNNSIINETKSNNNKLTHIKANSSNLKKNNNNKLILDKKKKKKKRN